MAASPGFQVRAAGGRRSHLDEQFSRAGFRNGDCIKTQLAGCAKGYGTHHGPERCIQGISLLSPIRRRLRDTLSIMPIVETSVWINAPLETVYAIAKDSEKYPEYMKEVQSVTAVERDGGKFVADWVGIVPTFGLKVRWRQEENWDDAQHLSHFRQVSGDYDRLDGTWTFAEENGGTRFNQRLDYEYNVPTLGPLVKKVIHTIVVKNLEAINVAFQQKATN